MFLNECFEIIPYMIAHLEISNTTEEISSINNHIPISRIQIYGSSCLFGLVV